MAHRIRISLLLLALSVGVASSQAQDLSDHPMIGEPAPAFALETTEGEQLSLEQLKGSFIVLHFGASW